MTSNVSLATLRRGESTLYLGLPGPDTAMARYHPAPSRNEIAVLQPVLVCAHNDCKTCKMITSHVQVKQIDGDLLTDVVFFARGLLTANKSGLVKLWIRPLSMHPRHLKGRTHTRATTDIDLFG